MPEQDEITLLRRHITTFIVKDILPNIKKEEYILEVGPTIADGNLRPYTLKDECEKRGAFYFSADIDTNIPADLYCSINDLPSYLIQPAHKIICLEIFEHVEDVWNVPKTLASILYPGGLVYASTPFYFLWHDPRPDLWRFTPDGINKLFSELFEITYFDSLYPPWAHDIRHSLHYNYILRLR